VIQLTQRRRFLMLSMRNALRGGTGSMHPRKPGPQGGVPADQEGDTVAVPRQNTVRSGGNDVFFHNDDSNAMSVVASTF
jgi:hypothetical protein